MDPSLMDPKELERRGRVIVEPCHVCHHNRQAHVVEGIFMFEIHGQRMERDVEDACLACTCLEFVDPPKAEATATADTFCCSFEQPHRGVAPLGVHWVYGESK